MNTTEPTLRFLLLEDDPNDAESILAALAAAGIECGIQRAKTRAEFVAALDRGNIDLVLAASCLPSFDGLAALKVCRKKLPSLPFIFISGAIDEEHIVEILRSGATDYVLKHRLTRLGSAVRRAIAEGERLSLESQAAKIEAVGRLAVGFAHDFNNLLTIVNGYSQILLRRTPEEDPARAELQEILEAGERASTLTQRLLSFSRHRIHQPKLLDLNVVLGDLDATLHRLAGDQISLEVRLDPEGSYIQVDQTRFEHLVLNLALNACEAMPKGGDLIVSVENRGNSAILSIIDTGRGMDGKTQRQMFEPFFTTKEADRGVGLGLWMVREAVKESQGTITVDSEPGRGTRITIRWPAAPKDTTVELDSPTAAMGETILLAEDEEPLRELAREILEPEGYRVLLARDGAEALSTIHREEDIRLLITDMTMPNMSGGDLSARLAKERPEMKILRVSGSVDSAIADSGIATPEFGFLSKPFTPGDLLRSVRRLLDMPPETGIVVLDDDPAIRSFLGQVLRRSGYRVDEAANGREAAGYLRQAKVDLLITDLIMPNQDGLETIQAVRKDFPRLRVIAMSGGFGEDYLEVAKRLGAQEILRKPFSAGSVTEMVRKLLSCPENELVCRSGFSRRESAAHRFGPTL